MLETLSTTPTLVLLLPLLTIVAAFWKKRAEHALPYPPGPKALLPFLGNVFDVPTNFQWITYAEWSKRYGKIIHLTILGQHLIIINSEEAAKELLDRRSRIYSDRPFVPVMKMNGWDIHTGMKRYGEEWRLYRRIFKEKFRQQAASTLHTHQQAKTRTLLHSLLQSPEDYVSHFEVYPASLILYLVYGYDVTSRDDPLVSKTFQSIKMFSAHILPAANFVNIFPSARHLPSWFPGLRGLHALCGQCRDLLHTIQNLPFNSVKQHMAQGTAVQSWTSELLQQNELREDPISETVIKAMGASLFSAAMETASSLSLLHLRSTLMLSTQTSAFLTTFVLAMLLHPEVQERAYAEIQEVIGDKRLPTHDDRLSLPYNEAIYRELLRWNGPTPLGKILNPLKPGFISPCVHTLLGIPHATTEDDIYEGHFIPKGTMIFSNQWAMCHDESIYTNPDKFMPERFLTMDGKLVDQLPPAFGFGRRACAGRSMAEASTWIAMVSMLSVFRITHLKDKQGKNIEVDGRFSDAVVTAPMPFECSIEPRSEVARQLILDNPALQLDSNPMFY